MPKEIDIQIPITTIWNPEKAGETVTGYYRDKISFKESKYDNAVYLIGNRNGECCAVNSHAVIERAMDRIPEGAFVNITFTGIKKGQKYNYKDFDIRAFQLDDSELKEFDSKVSIPTDRDSGSGAEPEPAAADAGGNDKDDDLPF